MTKAKKAKVKVEAPKGLGIKVKLDKSAKGRVTVKVILLSDGVEVASDYDFVQV